MGGPTTPYARVAADISDSTASGRSVLTGTAAQGATALGLGAGNGPTWAFGVFRNTAGGGSLEVGSSDGGPNDDTLLFRTSFAGTAGARVTGSVLGAPDAGSGGRLILSSLGVDGVIRAAVRIDAAQNVGVGTTSPATRLDVAGLIRAGSYTVATLPTGVVGALAYATNGRKVGEASGAGTGVIVYYSNGAWRRLSDDAAVAA